MQEYNENLHKESPLRRKPESRHTTLSCVMLAEGKHVDTGLRRYVGNLLMAVILTALMMSKAYGAEPKAASTVTGDTVTVGDVFADAGAFSDRYLAPAPAAGSAMTLNAHDLTRISDTFNLGWQPSTNAERVVIRRQSNDIDRYAIEAALQEKISDELGGQKFDLELADNNVSMHLLTDGDKTVATDKLKLDLQKGVFTATLSAPAGAPVVHKEVSGRIFTLTEVPVLKNPMRAGDVIDSHDIDYVDMRSNDISVNTVVSADRLIGQTPRRGIAAMKPVTAADIEAPTLVKKGELVSVTLNNGALNLSLQGRALQSGAEGEIVRVVNTASNRMLEGIVTGPQTITIKSVSAL